MTEEAKEPTRNMVGIKDLGKVRGTGKKVTLWHPTGRFKVDVDPLSANDLRQHQGFTNKDPKVVLAEAQAMVDSANNDGPSAAELEAKEQAEFAALVAKEEADKKKDTAAEKALADEAAAAAEDMRLKKVAREAKEAAKEEKKTLSLK